MGSLIWKPNHLKSGQKCPDFEWSGFCMVGTIAIAIAKARTFKTRPFEVQPSKSPDFRCFRISNVSVFQRVGFQIPTIFSI